jgi:hypothetical protein
MLFACSSQKEINNDMKNKNIEKNNMFIKPTPQIVLFA